MLTVEELCTDPALRLSLVGGTGADSASIEAAAVSELVEPGGWLQGGELLLTIGLLLPMTKRGCRSYLAHLAQAGVTALGLGLGRDLRFQAAPRVLIQAADELGLPLLTVPDGIPFIAVTKAVFAHHAAQDRQALEWANRTQRALTAAAVRPGGLGGILRAYRSATGGGAAVCDLLGRALAATDAGAAARVASLGTTLDAIRGHGLAAAAVEIVGEARHEVHPLGSHRLRAWLVLSAPAGRPSSALVIGDLVSLLSLELERRHGLDSAQRRRRGQLFARLARAGIEDAVAAGWLADVGVLDERLQVAVIGDSDDPGALAADVDLSLPESLVRVVDGSVEVAVGDTTDLSAALTVLAPRLPAGLGIAVRPGALAVSLRQARSALPESRISGGHLRAEDLLSARLLLSGVPPERLRAYADAVLGHLDADPRGAALVRDLAVFLERNGSWEMTATALGVHRHTVRNRIARIETLTGRRLDSAQDRQELWLAMRARDLAGAELPE